MGLWVWAGRSARIHALLRQKSLMRKVVRSPQDGVETAALVVRPGQRVLLVGPPSKANGWRGYGVG